MGRTLRHRRTWAALALAAGVAVGAQTLRAGLTWDVNGAATGTGGTGDWDTDPSHLFWLNSATSAYQAWADGNDASFSGAVANVTLRTNVAPLTLSLPTASAQASTIDLNGFNLSVSGAVTGLSANIITNNSASAATLTSTNLGPVLYSGNLNLASNGNWAATNANSYSGLLTINSGTVTAASNAALGSSSASVKLAGGTLTLNYNGTFNHNITLGSTTGGFQTGGNTVTLNGQISGSGDLRFTPTNGTLILGGNNSYTGNTVLTAAGSTLIVASNNALGNAPGPSRSLFATFAGTIAFQGDVNVTATPTVTINALGAGGKGSIHAFGGNNTFGGAITMNLACTYGAESNASLKLTGKVAGSSSRTFTKIGAGTIELASSANDYRGQTVVRNGILGIGTDAPLGDGNAVTGNYGALGNKVWSDAAVQVQVGDSTNTLSTDNLAVIVTGPYEVERPLLVRNDNSAGATRIGASNTSGTAAFSGAITLQHDVTLTSAPGGQVDFRPDTSTPFSVNATHLGTGIISGAANVTADGGGTVRLAAANTFGGAGKSLTVTGGTTLIVANNGNLGDAANTLTINNGTLKFEGVFDPSTSRTLTIGSGGAAFDTNSNNISFATPIASTVGGITKKGLGTLTLNGTNAHSGVTAISAGTLALAGGASIPNTSAISVAAGATLDATALSSGLSLVSGQQLGGNGTVTGNVTVSSGAILAPGSSVGTLNVGTVASPSNLSLEGGGSYKWELSDAAGVAGAGYDQLSLTGGLTINATSGNPFNVQIIGLAVQNLTSNQTFVIAHSVAPIIGFDPAAFMLSVSDAGDSNDWSIEQSADGKDLRLRFSSVPEPTSAALLATAAIGAAVRRRRRRRRSH